MEYLVPGKALHVWKVFASACYRHAVGTWHTRGFHQG
jgi:hypothetical protein